MGIQRGKHHADRKHVSGFHNPECKERRLKGGQEHSRKLRMLYDYDAKLHPPGRKFNTENQWLFFSIIYPSIKLTFKTEDFQNDS